LDNKIVPAPGLKLGAEFQFLSLKWFGMSAEPGVQISYEEVVRNQIMLNMLFSMEIKFPLKFFNSFVPEPYLAVAYPLRFLGKEAFSSFPMLGYGGGVQVSVKMEKNSAVFFEAGYMYFGDVGLKNQFTKPGYELYPNPSVIHYDYSAISFKIGYKYGFFDRKR